MSHMLHPAAPKPAYEPFLRIEQLATIGNAAEAQRFFKTTLVWYLGQCPYLTDKHFEVFRVVAASPCCDDPALSVLSQMMQRQDPAAAIETLLSLIRTECGKVGPEALEQQSFLYLQLLSFIFATGLFARRSVPVLNDRASFAVRTLISLRLAHLAGDSDALDALTALLTKLPDRIDETVAAETIRERLRSDEALLRYLGISEIASLLAQLRKDLPRFEQWEQSSIHKELLNFFMDEEISNKRIPLFPCIFQTVLDTIEWMEWSDTRLPVYPNLLYTADKRYSLAMCLTARAAFMRCISSNTQQERSEESFNRYAAGINEELTCDQKPVLVNDMLREQADRRDIFWWLHFGALYQSWEGEQADPQVLEFLEFAVRKENRVPTVLRHMERPLFWNWAVSKKNRSLIKVPDLLIPGWAKRLANKDGGGRRIVSSFALKSGLWFSLLDSSVDDEYVRLVTLNFDRLLTRYDPDGGACPHVEFVLTVPRKDIRSNRPIEKIVWLLEKAVEGVIVRFHRTGTLKWRRGLGVDAAGFSAITTIFPGEDEEVDHPKTEENEDASTEPSFSGIFTAVAAEDPQQRASIAPVFDDENCEVRFSDLCFLRPAECEAMFVFSPDGVFDAAGAECLRLPDPNRPSIMPTPISVAVPTSFRPPFPEPQASERCFVERVVLESGKPIVAVSRTSLSYLHPGVLFLRPQRPNEAAFIRDPSPVLDTEMSINEAAVLLPELKTLYEQSKESTLVRGAPSETASKTGTGSPCWRSWPDLRVTSTPPTRTALDTLLAKNIDRQEAAVLVENREDQEFAEERVRALKAELWNEEIDAFINNNWAPIPYIPGTPTTAFQQFLKLRYSLFAGAVASIEALADTRTGALSNDMCIVLGCALKFGIPVRLFECDGENIREVDPSSAVARNSVSFANLTADLAAARKNTAQESTVWVPCDWCDPDNWYGADYGNGLLDIGVPLLKRLEYWARVMNDTEYLQSSGYMDSEEERASQERKLIIRSMSERWPHILVR